MTPADYPALATEHLAACPLCGCADRSPVTDQDRAGFPAVSVCCHDCGLVYITPRMTAEGYAEFYRSGTYRQVTRRFNGKTYEEMMASHLRGQAVYAASMVRGLTALEVRRGQTLLDVGGSRGVTAKALSDAYGLQATVLEPSDEERAEAAAKGLETIPGTLDTWQPDRQYDVVTVFQTVDHFTDPLGALRKVRRLISPTGLLCLDVVDFRCLVGGLRSLERAVKIDHPCAFSAFNCKTLLERAGFWCEHIGGSTESVPVEFMLGADRHKLRISRKAMFVGYPSEAVERLPDRREVAFLKAMIEAVRNGYSRKPAGIVG